MICYYYYCAMEGSTITRRLRATFPDGGQGPSPLMLMPPPPPPPPPAIASRLNKSSSSRLILDRNRNRISSPAPPLPLMLGRLPLPASLRQVVAEPTTPTNSDTAVRVEHIEEEEEVDEDEVLEEPPFWARMTATARPSNPVVEDDDEDVLVPREDEEAELEEDGRIFVVRDLRRPMIRRMRLEEADDDDSIIAPVPPPPPLLLPPPSPASPREVVLARGLESLVSSCFRRHPVILALRAYQARLEILAKVRHTLCAIMYT